MNWIEHLRLFINVRVVLSRGIQTENPRYNAFQLVIFVIVSYIPECNVLVIGVHFFVQLRVIFWTSVFNIHGNYALNLFEFFEKLILLHFYHSVYMFIKAWYSIN